MQTGRKVVGRKRGGRTQRWMKELNHPVSGAQNRRRGRALKSPARGGQEIVSLSFGPRGAQGVFVAELEMDEEKEGWETSVIRCGGLEIIRND